jgi:16S rRNA (guanine527-N7)-methyltransferase
MLAQGSGLEILRNGAQDLGLTLSPRHLALFEIYYRELESWNQRFNLTAVTGYDEVQRRHFLDSLTCLLAFPGSASESVVPDTMPVQRQADDLRCADVGAGAGFPGLPIKLILPEIRMTLIEATGKKVTFLRHMVSTLGLSQVEIVHGRAEEVGHAPQHREQYDLVLARAVAHLAALVELCLPLCRVGGRVIAPKGEDGPSEVDSAAPAISTLGGRLTALKQVALPDLPGQRYLVVIDKVAPTPARYPRRAGIPAKRPLS